MPAHNRRLPDSLLFGFACVVHVADGIACFDEPSRGAEHTWSQCCHPRFGPAGHEPCWHADFDYSRCCTPHAAKMAVELSRREALSPAEWWHEQLEILAAAEETPDIVHSAASNQSLLREPVAVNFIQILGALVPDHRRNHYAVNIGANDGVTHDPVFPLFNRSGYRGLAVEADERWRESLERNMGMVGNSVQVHIEAVTPISIGPLLQQYQVPSDFDALKIDIDSFDGVLLRGILAAGYRPKVIMIEVNPDIPPPIQWELEYGENFEYWYNPKAIKEGVYGASPDALYSVLSGMHAYSLVALELMDIRTDCPFCEHNMWFVRNDFVGRVNDALVSWWGMVQLFWGQMELKNASNRCIHIHHLWSPGTGECHCPLNHIPRLVRIPTYASAGPLMTLAERSLLMASPTHYDTCLAIATQLTGCLGAHCQNELCPMGAGCTRLHGGDQSFKQRPHFRESSWWRKI